MDAYGLVCICGKSADKHAGADHPFLEKRPDYDPSTWLRAAFPYPTKAGPPSNVYIQLEDRLLIQSIGQGGPQQFTVSARILRPDGTILAWQQTVTSGGSFTLGTSTFDLVEGYLLSLVAQPIPNAFTRGSFFVVAALARGTGANAIVTQVLFADYVVNGYFLAFPGGRISQTVDGFGTSESLTIAAPVAGAELVFTMALRQRMRVRTIRFTFTTAVAVANREVTIVLDDGANIVARIPSNFTQAASLTEEYCFALGTQSVKGSVTTLALSPLPDVLLPAASRMRTLTTAIQAADQYSAAQMIVERWME